MEAIEQRGRLIRLEHRRFAIRRLRRLNKLRRIIADNSPGLGLPESPVQHAVNQLDRARCQARAGQGRIKRCEIGRTNLLKWFVTQMPTHMIQSKSVTLTRMSTHVGNNPIAIELIEKFSNNNLIRVN